MCEQEIAYNALLSSGAFRRLPKSHQIMFEAQCKDAKKSASIQRDLGERMLSVENDVQEIKRTMVTKDDLREQFKELRAGLSADLQKGAKYDFVQDIITSWKFWVLILIFIGALLGRGYFETIGGFVK